MIHQSEPDEWGVWTIRSADPKNGEGVLAFHRGSKSPTVRRPVYLGPADEFQPEVLLIGASLSDNEDALGSRDPDFVHQALLRNPLVAIRMLEALRDGKPGYFERLANAMRASRKEAREDFDDEDLLRRAIADASEAGGGIAPFVGDVAKRFKVLRRDLTKRGQPSDGDPEKLKPKLAKIGFGWLPSRKKGRPKKIP